MTLDSGKIIFILALLIRLWGIQSDLPNIYHYDEPHHMNVAARFGSGDLNPHDFKYPTLWPYVIASVLGILFAGYRIFGAVASSEQFAALFLTSPAIFYLSVRVLAALLVSLGIWLLYRTAHRLYGAGFATVVGLFAALTPALIFYAQETTPYALMLFLICAAIYFLDRLISNGGKNNYIGAGLALGLATSCHYTAGVFGAWLLALHFLRSKAERNNVHLVYGLFGCVAGFLIGTPFALLDIKTFLGSLIGLKNSQDTTTWNQPAFSWTRLGAIVHKLIFFLDKWGIGFALAIYGFVSLPLRKKIEYLAWLTPLLVALPFLSFSTFGASTRYLMGSFLILIFLAAHGFNSLWKMSGSRVGLKAFLCLVVFVPMTAFTYAQKHRDSLPDTRDAAEQWILSNVPTGAKIFLTDPFYSPQLNRSAAQVERLYIKTAAINHPREEYFRILMSAPQSDGYELYYLKRTIQEVWDIPERVEPAYQAQDWFDMNKSSLEDLKKEGISYVILDEHAVGRRKDEAWMKTLFGTYKLATEFRPVENKIKGPGLFIFDLRPIPNANAARATKAGYGS